MVSARGPMRSPRTSWPPPSRRTSTLVLILLALAPTRSIAGGNVTCDAEFGHARRLSSWRALRPVHRHDLPEQFLNTLARNDLARAAALKYRDGETLCFTITRARPHNGWGIQSQFLRRLIAAVFPRAVNCASGARDRTMVRLTLYDSVLTISTRASDVDMNNLKPVNPGPPLPPRAEVRAWLGLPAEARVISLYSGWASSPTAWALLPLIFTRRVADVVVWSTQDGAFPAPYAHFPLTAVGVRVVGSVAWADGDGNDPSNVVIQNETRGRLPYLHRASDVTVVMGLANAFESVTAGTPTLVGAVVPRIYAQARWNRVVDDLLRTGGARSFVNATELLGMLEVVDRPRDRVATTGAEYFLNRLLAQIIGVVDQRAAKTVSSGSRPNRHHQRLSTNSPE